MKKIILALLSGTITISMLGGCGKKSVKEQLIGTWKSDSGSNCIAFYEDGSVTAPGYFGILGSWDYIDGKIILKGTTTQKYDLEIIDDNTIQFQDHEWTKIEE